MSYHFQGPGGVFRPNGLCGTPFPLAPAKQKEVERDVERGVSDSSKALQASTVNGGGVLPPPTPPEKIADSIGPAMHQSVHGSEPANYMKELPSSLAWRTSTQTMMVSGLAGEVTPEELAKVPENLFSSGVVLRKGARRRKHALRRPV
tara:strand:+ start:2393 stop:2836 length:444 start_codon:yes stop_codon:yes gene_type:complete